jgi:hypothetical protein
MIIIAISIQVFAQNKKGNMIVGTNFGIVQYSTGTTESSNSLSSNVSKNKGNSFYLSVNPNIGFYLNDKTVLGGGITLAPYTSKNDNTSTGTATTTTTKTTYFYVGIGPYLREYLGTNNDKGMPFVQLNAGINFYPGYKNTYSNSTNTFAYTYKYSGYTNWMLGAQVGYEHFLNNIIGLIYSIGYSYYNYNYDYNVDYTIGGTDYTGTSKGNTSYINVNIGLNVHLSSLKGK